MAKKIKNEFVKEDVEIRRLFKSFKKQVEELRTKKSNLESVLSDIKRDTLALQEQEFNTLKNLQKLLQDTTEMNRKRAKTEAELNLIEDKLIKLLKISKV